MKRGPKPKPPRECVVACCSRPSRSGGMCNAHYARFRRWGFPEGHHPLRDTVPRICSIAGCELPHSGRGLCRTHLARLHKHGDPTIAKPKRPSGTGGIRYGYMVFQAKVNGRKRCVRRCRVVMEKIIGRPLLPTETVHHKNGIKDDDRECNLELWVSRHPRGQRVSDLIEYAHQILETYGQFDYSKEDAA